MQRTQRATICSKLGLNMRQYTSLKEDKLEMGSFSIPVAIQTMKAQVTLPRSLSVVRGIHEQTHGLVRKQMKSLTRSVQTMLKWRGLNGEDVLGRQAGGWFKTVMVLWTPKWSFSKLRGMYALFQFNKIV